MLSEGSVRVLGVWVTESVIVRGKARGAWAGAWRV